MSETIFALSTLVGKSGVAIVRLSGPKSLHALEELCELKGVEARFASFVELIDPSTKEVIDQAIAIYFQAPKSFTGEDVVEIQVHGSIAVINHLLEVLTKIPYVRMAEPGEFSKRAFMNNKMDLTQAEALADLIESETKIQKKIALRQLGGQLRDLYDGWRERMVELLSKLEALIDFPEDDIPESLLKSITTNIEGLSSEIEAHLSDDGRGELIQRGMQIAIVGEPNVGKSSLMNLIAKNDIAIVSDVAGTTRDVISVKIDLMGYPITLYDTAGLRESSDQIEHEGVQRAKKVLYDCDMQIIVLDSQSNRVPELLSEHISNAKSTFILVNKTDLGVNEQLAGKLSEFTADFDERCYVIEVSVKSGYAVDDFLQKLGEEVQKNYSISDEPLITRFRYRENLERAVSLLEKFKPNDLLEISSEFVRQASFEIGKITGRIDVEEVLDKIFSSFCIGK